MYTGLKKAAMEQSMTLIIGTLGVVFSVAMLTGQTMA